MDRWRQSLPARTQGLFSSFLNVKIDGELQRFSGDGRFDAECAQLPAVAIDNDIAGAVLAAQDWVVGLFNPGAADDIAGFIEGIPRIVEHVL